MLKTLISKHYLPLTILIATSLILPLFHSNSFRYIFIEPKFAFYDIVSSFITLYYFYYKKIFKLSLIPLLSFLILFFMLLSTIQSANIIYSFEFVFRFFNFIIFIALIYDLLESRIITIKNIGNLFTFTAFLFLAYYYYGTNINHIFRSNTSFSSIGHVNYTAHVLNIWIPLILLNFFIQTNKVFKYGSLIVLFLLVDLLILSGSRGSILGLIFTEVTIFIFLFIKHKKLIIYPIITSLLFISFIAHKYINPESVQLITSKIERNSQLPKQIQNTNNIVNESYFSYKNLNYLTSHRLAIYNNNYNMIQDNPWGVGSGNYEYLHPLYAELGSAYPTPYINERQVWSNPHNIIIKFISEIGWLGGCLFIFLLFLLLKMGYTLVSNGNKEDYLISIGLGATLFHSMLSAVFLAPVQLFFSIFLFTLLIYRYYQLKVYHSITIIKKVHCKCFLILIPIFFTLFYLSKYYDNQYTVQRNFNHIETALTLNPYNDSSLMKRAKFAAYAQNNYPLAINYVTKYLRLYPYNINGHIKKAQFEYRIGLYKNALKTINHLLSFDKHNSKMLQLRKKVLKRLKGKK